MLKLSSFLTFIKQKKILFCSLLFIVIAISIPQTASAGIWGWVADAATNALLTGLLGIVFFIPLIFVVIFSTITKIFLSIAITLAITESYTNSTAVQIGWPLVRDLANMVVVLGFVVIGIATILRIQDYEAKKRLPALIIAALLINFSKLICGIFIDGTNVFIEFFFGKVNVISSWFPAITDIIALYSTIGQENILDFAPKISGMMLFYSIAGFVNLLYFFLILGRILMLWMLVILSPLAFVCYVFPATKSIWQMWWKNFFQWCIIILPAGLFYYIGANMVSFAVANASIDLIDPSNLSDLSNWREYLSNAVSIILVPGFFLIAGFLVSLQVSAMGAGMITGMFSGAGIFAAGKYAKGLAGITKKQSGTLGKLTGWASGKAGGSTTRVGRMFGKTSSFFNKQQARADAFGGVLKKTRSAFGRGLEGVGAIPVGTQATKDDKALADAIKALIAALKSGNKKDEQRVFDKIHNGTGVEKIAAIQAAASENKLHEAFKQPSGTVDYNAMNDALVAAEKSGAPKNTRKDAVDKYYQMAGFSDKNVDASLTSLGHKATIDAELTSQGIAPGTASPAQRMDAARSVLTGPQISRGEEKANYTQLTKNWSSMDLEAKANTDLGGLHPDDFEEFALNRNAEDIKSFKLLEAGHDNRTTHKVTMLAYVNAELGTPGLSTNKQRRLREVRDELLKL